MMTLFEIYLRDGVTASIKKLEEDLKTLSKDSRARLSPKAQAYFEEKDTEIVEAISKLKKHLQDHGHD